MHTTVIQSCLATVNSYLYFWRIWFHLPLISNRYSNLVTWYILIFSTHLCYWDGADNMDFGRLLSFSLLLYLCTFTATCKILYWGATTQTYQWNHIKTEVKQFYEVSAILHKVFWKWGLVHWVRSAIEDNNEILIRMTQAIDISFYVNIFVGLVGNLLLIPNVP